MVTVITVTYGNRWDYLRQVLESIHTNELVDKIIVVDNGTAYEVSSKINVQLGKVTVLRSSSNDGSAAGFRRGLEYVSQSLEEGWVLLLDDDNEIDHKSLKNLMDSWHELSEQHELLALVAMREARRYLKEAAVGVDVKYLFPLGNDCFGFDVEILIGKVMYNLIRRRKILKKNSVRKFVEIPMAPYGGLFFHKRILSIIGFPDERYFAYADDYEFTYRIHARGGVIYLVSHSQVRDIEPGWINQSKRKWISSKYLEQEDFRAYLSIRNKIYFSKKYLVTNEALFAINLFLFRSYLYLVAFLSGKLSKYKLISRAIKEGLSGDLTNAAMETRVNS
ncbi:MAG: glycosyltransferase [Chitinophagales bacterium]|nr:glycosyltransferase [Bacteroidota bacterium]MBX7139511.1 glycosyltransferase [Chitinophagales bacterium]